MKKEVMKKWVKALRSGEFKQTLFRLKCSDDRDMAYCCLGVLCEISDVSKYGFEYSELKSEYEYCGATEILPKQVQEWAGMKNSDGRIDAKKTLSSLNDDGYSFKKIATIIEKNWKKL